MKALLKLALAALFACLVANAGAFAQDKAIDPAKEKEIRKLIDLMAPGSTFNASLDSTIAAMKKNMPSGPGSAMMDEFYTEFRKEFNSDEFVKKFYAVMIPLYDKIYTTDEIKELGKFYNSPLGKKTLASLPEVQQASMQIGMDMGRDAAQRAMAKIQQRKAAAAQQAPQ